MGTRSLTRINDSDSDRKIINMYRQFDGYLSGHGKELYDFLGGMVIINGISGQKMGAAANGAGCLAAQMIAKFKTEIGGIYLYPVEATDCGQEYEYVVTVKEPNYEDPASAIEVEVLSRGGSIFKGSVEEFGEFIERGESADDD